MKILYVQVVSVNFVSEKWPVLLNQPPLLFLPPVPDPPLIDLSSSKVYNEASVSWRLPEDHLPTDHHVLEYRRWVPELQRSDFVTREIKRGV